MIVGLFTERAKNAVDKLSICSVVQDGRTIYELKETQSAVWAIRTHFSISCARALAFEYVYNSRTGLHSTQGGKRALKRFRALIPLRLTGTAK